MVGRRLIQFLGTELGYSTKQFALLPAKICPQVAFITSLNLLVHLNHIVYFVIGMCVTIYAKIHSHVHIYVYISVTNVLCIYCINIHLYVDNICLLYIIQYIACSLY